MTTTQISFDPLNDEAAKEHRDARYWREKKAGRYAKRWVLKNQLRPYAGLGIPDGRIRDVYYLTVETMEA